MRFSLNFLRVYILSPTRVVDPVHIFHGLGSEDDRISEKIFAVRDVNLHTVVVFIG